MSLRSFFTRIAKQPQSWFRAVSKRSRLEAEMEAELSYHLESLVADLVAAGYSPAEAARRARIALGSPVSTKEDIRASVGLRWWDEFWADLRYGVRILEKNPSFTLIAATSLALAIGANTTIFSVAKQVLYDRLHVDHPETLRLLRWDGDKKVAVHSMWGEFDTDQNGVTSSSFSYPAYQQLRAENRLMEDMFAFKDDGMNATVAGNAQRVVVEMVIRQRLCGAGREASVGACDPAVRRCRARRGFCSRHQRWPLGT